MEARLYGWSLLGWGPYCKSNGRPPGVSRVRSRAGGVGRWQVCVPKDNLPLPTLLSVTRETMGDPSLPQG